MEVAQVGRLEKRIEVGERAERAQESMAPYLQYRREQVIEEMLAWFRGQDSHFDPTVSIKYIAILNEVEALLEQIQREVKEGKQAQKKLYGNPTAA